MIPATRLKNRLLAYGFCLVVYTTLVVTIVLTKWPILNANAWLFMVFALVGLVCFSHRYLGMLTRDLKALEIAVLNLADNNFSVSMPKPKLPEMQQMVDLLNKAFKQLREQRRTIYQKEFLLNKVIENAPMAMLSCDGHGHILFANTEARHLFNQGRAIEGLSLTDLLDKAPDVFRQAINGGAESLFQLERDGERVSYHYSLGEFNIDMQVHKLYLFKEITREINRQEVASWKKTIKVISHELNNSLAPISSMAHSSKRLAERDDKPRLIKTLGRIEASVTSLHDFIQRYAAFARLPLPNKQPIMWTDLLLKLHSHHDFKVPQQLPSWPLHADSTQLLQALINVLKNAHESGSDPSEIGMELGVELGSHAGKTVISIFDRGTGMSSEVMEQALIPFYSTKTLGSGIGLALCQEIVEAHYGKLTLENRKQGGLRVSLTL